MKTYINPTRKEWDDLCRRPSLDIISMLDIVRPIMDDVAERGDEALFDYEKKFDKVDLVQLRVTEDEFATAINEVPADMKLAIRRAYDQIKSFHAAQRFAGVCVETAPGVICEQKAVPISKVGLYIPGGSAPLFSTVLMLGVPARIAGCEEVVLCTPPRRDGTVNPIILFTAQLCGISLVCKVGGSQAIAAMAKGTESVPKVDKIFGPGNQFVMATKQLAALMGTAIDMPAGPSEVEVIADESARVDFVAADLLSQAEHGADSQVMLVTTSERIATEVAQEVDRQLALLPRKEIAEKSLVFSKIIVLDNKEEVIEFTNTYAPEHLIIATNEPRVIGAQITHAGSVFLGHFSCESAGDYASGTNHTLPTMGYARSYGGLCLDSFIRKMTYQELSAEGIRSIGQTVALMAKGEELDAHRKAMTIRMKACGINESSEVHESCQPCGAHEQLSKLNLNDSAQSDSTESDLILRNSTDSQCDKVKEIAALVRPNVLKMKPYSCARDEYSGKEASVFLDANESPYNQPLNRYPDPLQLELKEQIVSLGEFAQLQGVQSENIFLGNGSDEAIDLIFRVFCRPNLDNVVAIEPTYGMYSVCAATNEVEYRTVPLNDDFSFTANDVMAATDEQTKVIFLCSPNNPTGNLLSERCITSLLESFRGVVVVDEAYIDFAPGKSVCKLIADYPRLIVLRTFSKAWASAGIRLGMALSSAEIIGYFNKVKYPYNVNRLTQKQAMDMLRRKDEIAVWVKEILKERERMSTGLAALPICKKVYPSDANFILIKVENATSTYNELANRGIIVRNRTSVALCENCLRITIGTAEENNRLLEALKSI